MIRPRRRRCWRLRGLLRGGWGFAERGQEAGVYASIPAASRCGLRLPKSIQQDLQAVGITMTVRQMEFNQLLAAMVGQPQAWQAILMGMNFGAYPSGEELFARVRR